MDGGRNLKRFWQLLPVSTMMWDLDMEFMNGGQEIKGGEL